MPMDTILNMVMAVGQRAAKENENENTMSGDRKLASGSGSGENDDEHKMHASMFVRGVESAIKDNIRDWAAMVKVIDGVCKIAGMSLSPKQCVK